MWFIVSDITRGGVKFKIVGCIWWCTNDEAVMDWMHWIPWMAKDIKSARHLTYVNHFWNVNSITISIDFTAMLKICVLPRLKRVRTYLAALKMLSTLSFCDTVVSSLMYCSQRLNHDHNETALSQVLFKQLTRSAWLLHFKTSCEKTDRVRTIIPPSKHGKAIKGATLCS